MFWSSASVKDIHWNRPTIDKRTVPPWSGEDALAPPMTIPLWNETTACVRSRLLDIYICFLQKSMAFCPNCGREVPPQAIFCPSCGHPLMQMRPAVKPGPTTAVDVQAESAALRRITWYAIIQIAGVAGSIVTYLLFLPGFFSRFPITSGGTASASDVASWLQGLLFYLAVVAVVMLAIGLIAVFLLLSAFRRLSRLDSPNFSTPATLMILLLVGVVIVGIGLIPLFWMLSALLSNIVQNPTTYTLAGGQVWDLNAAAALIAIGGILGIIGVIGGEILGLWRVGTRYDSTLIKISAIFIIIPYLNWVGPILLLVGALEARKKLGPRPSS
jgi:hypothetical protein